MLRKKQKLTRRNFLQTSGIGLALISSIRAQQRRVKNTNQMLAFVGTYTSGALGTSGKSKGIYVYKFDSQNGALTLYKIIANTIDPSFLAIDSQRRFLYAVNETNEFAGKPSGAVSAFAINQKTGDLQFLNQQASLGGAPCHLTLSDNNKFVLVANYAGGNVSVFPIGADGRLGAATDVAQHRGSSVNRERQEAAHAHQIALDKSNRFAFACDLGADKIFIYRFDQKNGKLAANSQPFFQAKPGAGPRHLSFHPSEKFAFVINELDSTITALAYDKDKGELKEIQNISTLPADFSGSNTCAEIQVSPDGKFLYGSNRGHDSIVSYKINAQNGSLELVEHVSTEGKTPRYFTLDPTGNFLLAGNQHSDNVSIFRVNAETGKLSLTEQIADVPAPVCIKFIQSFD